MSRILYIFPHPDDESFGPAPAMARQRREGHEVYLLTLTHGEATSQRQRLGYTKEHMGAVRLAEMQEVAQALSLNGMTVLDLPDGGLDTLDPIDIEDTVSAHVETILPDVVVTYAVHGISGHPDHLVSHAVVKRVFCALQRDGRGAPRRLAFFTLPESDDPDRPSHLRSSPAEHIDCVVTFHEEDLRRAQDALSCYETYRPVIEQHEPLKQVTDGVCFELFREDFEPALDDLFARL